MKPIVILIATFDTKGIEAEFIKQKIIANGAECITLDVGVGGCPTATPDIPLEDLCTGSKYSVDSIRSLPRGEAVAEISNLLEVYIGNLFKEKRMACIAGIGGAGGTQIVTQAMRTLPFGLPKMMLSTLASGNTRWYMKSSDITMIPSIADVSGINCITSVVYERFASLTAKAALWYAESFEKHTTLLKKVDKLRISQTMYGTTTKGVTRAKNRLEDNGFETIVFHASGAGGQAMESFIKDGIISGVLDMTLAEIGAYIAGGLHNAGPNRLEAAAEMGIPQVIVPGAADTVVLPPASDLPDKFKGRTLNFHNPTMTTMRTNVEECIKIGEFICEKVSKSKGPVKVVIPEGGLSSIDKPGQIFYYPEANEALFSTLKNGLKGTGIEVIEDKRHIYDPGFGEFVADVMTDMMKKYYKI